MDRDGEVRRQRPRRGRPDRDARLAGELPGNNRELYVNRCVLAVLVFDLRLSECGLRAAAPINWLQAFINEPLLHENRERAQDIRFVTGIEGEVRVLPLAENAEPFELLALDIDE